MTRVSLGIQSFSDAHLKALGRIHDASEARAAVPIIRADSFRVGESRPDTRCPAQASMRRARRSGGCDRFRPGPSVLLSPHPRARTPSTPRRRRCSTTILPPTCREMIEARRRGEAGYRHYQKPRPSRSRAGVPAQPQLHWHWRLPRHPGAVPTASSSHTGIAREMRYKHPTAYLAGAASWRFRAGSASGRGRGSAFRVHDDAHGSPAASRWRSSTPRPVCRWRRSRSG